MLNSMTGFARSKSVGDWGTISWEVRSVNHRYLEMVLRLPEELRALEPTLREKAQALIGRGKVEATLKYTPGEATQGQLNLNEPLLAQIKSCHDVMKNMFNEHAPMNLVELMRWPGVLQVEAQDLDKISPFVTESFIEALTSLNEVREREGKRTAVLLQEKLKAMQALLAPIKGQITDIIKTSQEKIKHRFDAAKLECDPERLEQEMLYFVQKIDVTEELERLEIHLKEANTIIGSSGLKGRKLDFLMQELNREANTLASKSVNTLTTQAALEMKVLIEQMREQVQNIE